MADPLLQTFQLKHLHLKIVLLLPAMNQLTMKVDFQKIDILLIIWKEQEVE